MQQTPRASVDALSALANQGRFYTLRVGADERVGVPYARVQAVLAGMVALTPGFVPSVTEETPGAAPAMPSPAYVAAPVAAPIHRPQGWSADASHVDGAGAARSAVADRAARAAGFAPAQPIFARGTRVNDLGVANARQARVEHDALPTVDEACDALVATVAAEGRRDVTIDRRAVLMDATGRLVLSDDRRVPLEERAYRQVCARLGIPAQDAWARIRAQNFNGWAKALRGEGDEEAREWLASHSRDVTDEGDTLVLRTRLAEGTRSAYGVVSEKYTPFDADQLAHAVRLAMPPGARCRTTYDGTRAKFEVMFHSTVRPEDFVAGEFFRGGITIRTDDTGGGSLTGSSFVEQNLCLNLIIIDRAAQPTFRIRHMGDVAQLAKRIREGLAKSEASLQHFLGAWGYARRDDLRAAAIARGEIVEGMTMGEVFNALANGAIERELVPVRGQRKEVLRELHDMWRLDKSSDGPSVGTVTRSGLVNSFTRWAHEVNSDPFFAGEVERSASALLWPASERSKVPGIIQAIPV